MIKQRNITETQERFLNPYLEKSKDTLDEFLNGNNNVRKIAEFDDLGRRKYRRLTFDERQAKFDEFFNETTEFGAARTNKLLDDLGDLLMKWK